MKITNTLIVGAGQAGLSLSYFLKQKGVEHVILERGKVGEEWRSRRWDNFHLITPNHMTNLPGFSYKGDSPNGFDSKNEVIKYFEDYAESFNAPIIEGAEVTSVTKTEDGFLVKTDQETYTSKNVVIAVGSFHQPLIPEISKELPKDVLQIHSSEYKNSAQLPEGASLIVGGGNSGIQIAVDLNNSGRKTYLSMGRVRIVPRHYKGKDFMEWAEILGILDRKTEETSDEIKNTPPPILFGYQKTVDLRQIAKDGIQLVGRLKDITDNKFIFDNNVQESIEKGEAALSGFKATVDKYITDNELDTAEEKAETENFEIPQGLEELDLHEIKSVIWATGFKDDWSWLDLDILDSDDQPIHTKGVSKIPGLYFIGLRWLSKYKSFLLCGVKEDAEFLAKKLTKAPKWNRV